MQFHADLTGRRRRPDAALDGRGTTADRARRRVAISGGGRDAISDSSTRSSATSPRRRRPTVKDEPTPPTSPPATTANLRLLHSSGDDGEIGIFKHRSEEGVLLTDGVLAGRRRIPPATTKLWPKRTTKFRERGRKAEAKIEGFLELKDEGAGMHHIL